MASSSTQKLPRRRIRPVAAQRSRSRSGGKYDELHGAPIETRAYVKSLSDGRLVMQAMGKGSPLSLGKMARLVIDGIDVIVASRRSQTFDPEPFLAVGIDVNRYRIVALKSSNHFRAGFKDVAGAIVTADPPGLTTHHVEVFPRQRASGTAVAAALGGRLCGVPETTAHRLASFAALLASAAAFADETVVVTGVLGPEGPLYVDGNLYYVGWISNALSKWDGKTAHRAERRRRLRPQRPGADETAHLPDRVHERSRRDHRVDMNGKELRRWSADADGRKFDGGINDVVVTANGGVICDGLRPVRRSANGRDRSHPVSAAGRSASGSRSRTT